MPIRTFAAVLTIALLPCLAVAQDGGAAIAPDHDVPDVVRGQVSFTSKLYDQLRGDTGNVVFSPYSVQNALAMTMAGANGATASEIYKALSLPHDIVHARPEPGVPQPWLSVPWPQERVHGAMGRLTSTLEKAADGKAIQLNIANSIWPAAQFEMRDAFVNTLKQSYGVTVTPTTYPDPGRQAINQWVEGRTNNRIKDLLAPGSVDADTQLVLVNAIYFKGNWRHPFDAEITRDQPFHLTAEKQVDVATMLQTEHFKYFGDAAKQVLEMPYKGDALSMVIVLPKKIDGLADVEKNLDLGGINQKLAATRQREVIVQLPKFKYEYTKTLNAPLQAMGMKLAFTDEADFTNMSPDGERLCISLVQHKAFIEVNETGSEAAAATAVAVATKSAAIKSPPLFRADRPFLFYIRHVETGAILFVGRVSDPRG